jgi:hypothetical protein
MEFADGVDNAKNTDDDEDLEDGEDGQQYAEGEDAEDAADGGADDAEEEKQQQPVRGDRHGALTTRHRHGKFGMHAHEADGDHSGAPLKSAAGSAAGSAAKGKQMGEERRDSEVRTLTEQVATLQKQLHEQRVDKQLAEWGGATFTLSEKGKAGAEAKRSGRVGLSKEFREKYRAFALGEGIAMGETRFAKLNELLSTLLSDGLVDLSVRALGSFEQDERSTFALGDPEAESRRLSERTRELAAEQFHKELRELSGDQVARLQRQAAKDIGYRRAAQ